MKDNEKLYHSALSRCAEQLDNMRDGDPITDVPDFLAAKLKQCQLAGAAKGGNTISTIGVWTGHEISDDPSLNFVEFVKLSDVAHLAGQSQELFNGVLEIAVPGDVRRALDRMCTPLDESRLAGATAQEDARCMQVIKSFIDGIAGQSQATRAVPVAWMNPNEGCSMDAFLWQKDPANPQYSQPVYAAPTAQEVTQQAASDNVLSSIADELEDAAIPYEGDFADTVRANVEALREVACGLPSFAGKGLCGQCAKVGRCLGCPSLAPTTQRAAKAEIAKQAGTAAATSRELDLIRTMVFAVDQFAASDNPNDPAPWALNSLVVLAARRLCHEYGYEAGDFIAPTTSTVSAPDEQDDENDDTCRFCEGQGEVQGQGSAQDIEPPIKKCSVCNGSGKASYYRTAAQAAIEKGCS